MHCRDTPLHQNVSLEDCLCNPPSAVMHRRTRFEEHAPDARISAREAYALARRMATGAVDDEVEFLTSVEQ